MSTWNKDSSADIKRQLYNGYVCGFNGYCQLPHLGDGITEPCDKTTFVTVPVSINASTSNIEPVMTFSNFYNISESGDVRCHGFNSSKLDSDLKQQKLKIHGLLKMGSSGVILQSQEELYIANPDDGVHKVTCRPSEVEIKDATSEEVYGIANGILHRAAVSNSEQDGYRLDFSPLLTRIIVSQVSCGVEHTLILTVPGEVMACGKGSRGQLGQGTCSVDVVTTPVCVTTLEGVEIVGVAAGGWHSVAVSACGDAYVWGWNLHGQLGLPSTGLEKTDVKHSTDRASTNHISCSCPNVNKEGGKPVKGTATSYGNHGRIKTMDQLEYERFKGYASCEKCGGLKECDGDHIGSEGLLSVSAVKDQEPGDEAKLGDLKVLQDVVSVVLQTLDSPVHVQMEPYGLDFPESFHVAMVSCGTRHTCIILDSGVLLTSGWNKYGQLCHGDTDSRDYFQAVDYFVRKQEVVKFVKAEAWNTYITTNKIYHRCDGVVLQFLHASYINPYGLQI